MAVPVVICDDSRMARKQMQRSLPPGWAVEVHFAANGREALEALHRLRPALLFLDLTMPEMDGFQTLEAMAAADITVPTIVVSGDVQLEAQRRVAALGALEFIQKPCKPEQLHAVLARHGLVEPGPDAGAVPAPRTLTAGLLNEADLLDACQEVANVAMGRAAALLARLLDVFVVLPVPRVNMLDAGELHMAVEFAGQRSDSLSAVCQGFIGSGIAGEALLIFDDASFRDVARLMKVQGELDRSAELEVLMDVASVLIGACLNGLAEQLDLRFSQGHPAVLGQHCRVEQLITANARRWRRMLAVEIDYAVEGYAVRGDLLLLFTEDSVAKLNGKLAHLL